MKRCTAKPPARVPDDAIERRAIRDAMDRLISGAPIRSDGKLTVKSLAIEADVKRWRLTHKHTDLQDEFRARVAQQEKTPVALKRVLDDHKSLRERTKQLTTDLQQAQAELARYARVVQVLTLENQALQASVKTLTEELTARVASGEVN